MHFAVRHIGRSHGPCQPSTRTSPVFKRGDGGADGFARGRRSRARPAPPPEFPCGWWRRSSLRGLSSVTITSSASLTAICAHQRALALVAVAAAAEHDMQVVCGMRAQRFQNFFQRIGRMGVIDIDRRAIGGDRRPSPSGPARLSELSSAANTLAASSPRPMARPAATSALEAWNAPASGSST